MGGYIGKEDEVRSFVRTKIEKWAEYVDLFSKAAVKYPQAVYAAFTKSLQSEWNYMQRVIPGHSDEYIVLKNEIERKLIPAIFGREILEREFCLLEMPVKWGGMALRNPVKTACNSSKHSVNATCMITHAIKNGHKLDVHEHNGHAIKALKESKAVRDNCFEIQSETVIEQLPTRQQKVLKRILDGNMSSWLSVLPTQQDGYDLSAQQFRDQLAMRYGREL